MSDLETRLPVSEGFSPTSHGPEVSSVEQAHQNSFYRVWHVAKRAAQATVIAAEIGPVNEAARYSVFAASQTMSDSPLIGAAALGGATLVIEGAAALASASALDTETAHKAIGWVNDKLNKFVPKESRMSKPAEAGVALLGGSVVVMAAKQREDPERTANQNRKYGLFTAAWLAGVCAVQGALMSEGIHDATPEKAGVAVLAVVGLYGAAKWLKNRYTRIQ